MIDKILTAIIGAIRKGLVFDNKTLGESKKNE